MTFAPDTIELEEGDADNPYDWSMTTELTWTGEFRGRAGRLRVPASEQEPFRTDLASVPRALTWLFPRYGRYTKAAVLHDYFCQTFRQETIEVFPTPADDAAAPRLLELRDRSDADEIFRLVMKELGVPWARRWLMWSAVSLGTLAVSLRAGRASKRVARWVGLAVVAAAVVAAVALVVTGALAGFVGDPGWRWLRVSVLVGGVVIACVGVLLLAGYIAQARWDRWLVYLGAFAFAVASLPLLAGAAIVAVLLAGYLLFEDAFSGFSGSRARLRRLFAAAPPPPEQTPKQARVAEVRGS